MKKLLLLLFLAISFIANSQVDSAKQITQTNLLFDLKPVINEPVKLLPEHYLFTQKLLWGEKGLMRNFDSFKLSPEERDRELKIRRFLLETHQTLGFITVAAMWGKAFTGYMIYNQGNWNFRTANSILGVMTVVGYYSIATMALFSPPMMINQWKGYSSVKVHKYLAMIHFTGMVLTTILSTQMDNAAIWPYHRAAAIITLASFTTAMLILKF